jgi:hypothetical protein
MFERLKQLAARLAGRLPFRNVRIPADEPPPPPPPSPEELELEREMESFPDPPEDPFAGVRAPRRRGPGGRHSGIALTEPEPDELAGAVGRLRRHRQGDGA